MLTIPNNPHQVSTNTLTREVPKAKVNDVDPIPAFDTTRDSICPKLVSADSVQDSHDELARKRDHVVQQVKSRLRAIAKVPADFQTLFTAFGDDINHAKLDALREMILVDDWSFLPALRWADDILPTNVMGAYSRSTGTVYLATPMGLREQTLSASVYAEELGHHLETLLKADDTAGDEGEHFARLLSGEELSPTEIRQLTMQNDHGYLHVDGEDVPVEFWGLKDLIDVITAPVRIIVEEIVAPVVENVVAPVVDGAAAVVSETEKTVTKAATKVLDTVAKEVVAPAAEVVVNNTIKPAGELATKVMKVTVVPLVEATANALRGKKKKGDAARVAFEYDNGQRREAARLWKERKSDPTNALRAAGAYEALLLDSPSFEARRDLWSKIESCAEYAISHDVRDAELESPSALIERAKNERETLTTLSGKADEARSAYQAGDASKLSALLSGAHGKRQEVLYNLRDLPPVAEVLREHDEAVGEILTNRHDLEQTPGLREATQELGAAWSTALASESGASLEDVISRLGTFSEDFSTQRLSYDYEGIVGRPPSPSEAVWYGSIVRRGYGSEPIVRALELAESRLHNQVRTEVEARFGDRDAKRKARLVDTMAKSPDLKQSIPMLMDMKTLAEETGFKEEADKDVSSDDQLNALFLYMAETEDLPRTLGALVQPAEDVPGPIETGEVADPTFWDTFHADTKVYHDLMADVVKKSDEVARAPSSKAEERLARSMQRAEAAGKRLRKAFSAKSCSGLGFEGDNGRNLKTEILMACGKARNGNLEFKARLAEFGWDSGDGDKMSVDTFSLIGRIGYQNEDGSTGLNLKLSGTILNLGAESTLNNGGVSDTVGAGAGLGAGIEGSLGFRDRDGDGLVEFCVSGGGSFLLGLKLGSCVEPVGLNALLRLKDLSLEDIPNLYQHYQKYHEEVAKEISEKNLTQAWKSAEKADADLQEALEYARKHRPDRPGGPSGPVIIGTPTAPNRPKPPSLEPPTGIA